MLWQNKSFGDKVEVLSRETFLHLANILCKPVLPSQLNTGWKVIYLLVLVQPLVEVTLTLGVRPEHVPIVAIRRNKAIDFEKEADQF